MRGALALLVLLGCAREEAKVPAPVVASAPVPVVVDAAVVRPVDAARAAGADRMAAAREAGMLDAKHLGLTRDFEIPPQRFGGDEVLGEEPIDVQCQKACDHLMLVAQKNTIVIDSLPTRTRTELEAIASTAGGVNRDACEDHCEAGRFQAACTARIETVRDFGRCLTR